MSTELGGASWIALLDGRGYSPTRLPSALPRMDALKFTRSESDNYADLGGYLDLKNELVS